MSLKVNIDGQIKQAMLSKDQDRLRALRAIKAAILLAETESGAKADLSSDDEIKILVKMSKQRKDSAEMYKNQNRQDLYEKEISEIAVIEEFLPKQLSEAEITVKLKEIVAKLGVTEAKEMGKVMGVATKELAGQADGKTISAILKTLLQ